VTDGVREFWQEHPVDTRFNENQEGSPAFFDAQHGYRYRLQPHIPEAADFASWRGRDVLEVGCGVGTDAVEIVRAGARYTGVDVTQRAVSLTRQHLAYRGLVGRVEQGDATRLPFPDASFDIVYSHGVLHHIPDIDGAVAEVHRVLRPGGRAIVMLYHRRSLNYLEILTVRRLGALALLVPGVARFARRLTRESATIDGHRSNLRRYGLSYLSAKRFLNHNTDGPENPLSRVFSAREARRLFASFEASETRSYFLNLRWLLRLPPFRWTPHRLQQAVAREYGWHLWIYARK
jgi:ubiquinone/menaquinone biosynthesis C-methylase UbiE